MMKSWKHGNCSCAISKQPKKDNSADKTKTLTKSKIMAKMTNNDSVDERHQH